MTPQAWTVAATGKQQLTSSFSKASTTMGYCSCAHLNCRVAHTPVDNCQVNVVLIAMHVSRLRKLISIS